MWGDNEKHKLSLNQDENFTFLGRGVDFNGVISFEGTVRIDGRLKGKVVSEHTLIVGESAQVEAEIDCGVVSIRGSVSGRVQGRQRIELLLRAARGR